MVKGKCSCNLGMGILGLILLTAGLYFVVWGFITQTVSAISWSLWNWNALLFYLIGIVLIGLGKMSKYKGYGCCSVHGMTCNH